MARGLIVCMPFENHVPGRVSLKETWGERGTIIGGLSAISLCSWFSAMYLPGIERFRMGMNMSGNFDFVERFFFSFFLWNCEGKDNYRFFFFVIWCFLFFYIFFSSLRLFPRLWILPKKLGIRCKFIFTSWDIVESLQHDNFEWWMVMRRNFIGESVMNGGFCVSGIGD